MSLRPIAWPSAFLGFALGSTFIIGVITGLWVTQQSGSLPNLPFLQSITQPSQPGTLQVVPPSGSVSSSIPEVVEKTRPAVVTVAIRQTISSSRGLTPFDLFFGAPVPEVSDEPIQQDIGSGFVVSTSDGLVVTNRHVVSNSQAEYIVIDNEGGEHPVEQIYRDPVNDLAILQISSELPSLPLGDSEMIRIGEPVIAIGTALGEFRQTVTSGIVSGVGRGIEAQDGLSVEHIEDLIQTDAAINPGNSGGPLLNDRGEVIGVNVAVARAENIGFALPINAVRASLDNFSRTGEFSRAYLGVQYRMITEETAVLNDVPAGAYITRVFADSPAESGGLEEGDIVIRIDEQRLSEVPGGLAAVLNTHIVGDAVEIEVWRDDETLTLTATLDKLELTPPTP